VCSKLPDTADIVREAIFRQVIDRLEPGQRQTPDAKTLGYQHLPKALPFDSSPVSKFMEISHGDPRRFGLILASVFILAAVVLGIGFVIRLKTPFEQEQARAEAGNPKWLSVKITTADDRLEYHESEPIVLIARFSSRARYMYKVEAAEGLSKAAVDLLHTSNGQRIPLNRTGIVCCDSRLIGLDDEPYIPPTRTPLKLTAGEYEIYLTRSSGFQVGRSGTGIQPKLVRGCFKSAEDSCSSRFCCRQAFYTNYPPPAGCRSGCECNRDVSAIRGTS